MAYTPTEQESELAKLLVTEEQEAIAYTQQDLSAAQIDALARYFGDKYGDEVEGRSQMTTRELFEVVEWLRPEFGRLFAGGDRCVEFEGTSAASDEYAGKISDYINYIFTRDNQGAKIIDELTFDGLVQRIGVIAAEWKQAEYSAWQPCTGLNSEQIDQLLQDPATEIDQKSLTVEQGVVDDAHPDGILVSCKIRERTKAPKADVFTIAPEDMRIAARTVDLDEARYAGDVVRMMRGDAITKWPKYEEEIRAYQGRMSVATTDSRRAARFRDLLGNDLAEDNAHDEAEEIEVLREFVRYDMDGDGYPEMLRCFRINSCLLEYDEVDEHIYSCWTPIPVPHRLIGLSVADEVTDLQKAKTVLLRGMLDSVAQANTPRMGADRNSVNLDALLDLRPGVVIDTDGPPADKLFPVVTPDLSQSALGAMQWIDQIAQMRTGVNRIGQGMDPDVLNKMVVKGVQFIQNADSLRKEQYARNFAIGLEHFFAKLYRLVHRHQNEARTVKIAGEYMEIDPRTWEADMRCTVTTGLGTGAKEAHLAMLQMIQQDQMLAYQTWGETPMVGLPQMYNTVRQKLRVMGYSSADSFFGKPVNPDGTPFQAPPKQDPDIAKVQAQSQADQQRLQADAQAKQQQMQIDLQTRVAEMQAEEQKAKAEAAQSAQESAMKIEVMREEMQAKIELEREKAANESAIAQQTLDQQMQIAMAELAMKERIAREEIAMKERVGKAQAVEGPDDGSDTPMKKFRPGGSLAA